MPALQALMGSPLCWCSGSADAGRPPSDFAGRIRRLLHVHGPAHLPHDRTRIRHQYFSARRRFHGPPELHSRCAPDDQRRACARRQPSPFAAKSNFAISPSPIPLRAATATQKCRRSDRSGAPVLQRHHLPRSRRFDSGHRRPHRQRQVHAGRADRAPVGSACRHAPHRRPLHPRMAAGHAAPLHRLRAAGYVPVQRNDARKHRLRRRQRHRRAESRRRRSRQHRRGNQRASPPDTTPWSASAASRFPAARSSAPPWPAPSFAIRAS